MSNLKLGVEVVSASNLLPKDGQGTSNAFVELRFDGQKIRTAIGEKDLSPVWNETFYFNISNPNNLPNLPLKARVYKINKTTRRKSSFGFGKVLIAGTSFVPHSSAVVLHYPLEKGSIFSCAKARGELRLRVFVRDDPLDAVDSPEDPSSWPHPYSAVEADENPQNERNVARQNIEESSRNTFDPQTSYFEQSTEYGVGEMRLDPQASTIVGMHSSSHPSNYAPKETSPFLGCGQVVGGRVLFCTAV